MVYLYNLGLVVVSGKIYVLLLNVRVLALCTPPYEQM